MAGCPVPAPPLPRLPASANLLPLAGGRSYEVVGKTVAKLVEWLDQSSTGLYPAGAKLTGSKKQDLHIQNDTSASNFNFLVPLRFNPTLQLMGSINVWDLSCDETRLPNDRHPSKKVSAFCWGSKLVLDLDTLRAEGTTPNCNAPSPRTGNSSAGQRDQFEESIDNHHLDPVRILQDFHRDVQNALTAGENSHPRDNERMTLQPWDPTCPAVQLIFRLGEEELVSVDLGPTVQDKVVLSEDWQRSDLARLSNWWDKEPGNSQEKIPFSFANAETAFLRDIDSDGGQRREALRLLKFINKECWVPEYGKILTSYHLKTMLLWAQVIHPEKEKWETLASSLKTLLSLLRHCVNKGKLPHYFLRDFNLFNKRYREGSGFYERLALQVLDKEGELLEEDPVRYISLRVPKKDAERPGAFSRAEASLQGFKASQLKELEEKRLYEWEEEEPGDENVCDPARRKQDREPRHFNTIFPEKKQCLGQSPQCQGKAKAPVRAPSEQVTFSPDLDQELHNPLLPLEIQAPRDRPVQAAERFGTVDVTSENYPGFKNDASEAVHLVRSLAHRREEELTLDPATAHPLLEISADGKEVRCGTSTGNVSSSPRRFDTANCVVARQSFNAGRHYWEVSVGRKRRWNLGVVSDLAERRGRLIQRKSWWPWLDDVICAEGYWLIGYNQEKPEKPYWAFDTNPMPFDCNPPAQAIGVYLNYTDGEVTFYNTDDPRKLKPLYTFYNAAFDDAPVYPIFDPCFHDNKGNTQPLKIL